MFANIWLESGSISMNTLIYPIPTGTSRPLVPRSVEVELTLETQKTPKVHYMETRHWLTSIAKHHTVTIPTHLPQISAVEAQPWLELVGYRSEKVSLNTVHLRDATKWHTVPHIYSVYVMEEVIDARNQVVPAVHTRRSIARVTVVARGASGTDVRKARYRIQASVDVMEGAIDVSIPTVLRGRDRDSISV